MTRRNGAERAEDPPKIRSVGIAARIDAELKAEVDSVVVELSGPPEQMTLTQFIEDALRRHLAHLRRLHGPRLGTETRGFLLRKGRPIRPR